MIIWILIKHVFVSFLYQFGNIFTPGLFMFCILIESRRSENNELKIDQLLNGGEVYLNYDVLFNFNQKSAACFIFLGTSTVAKD